MTPGATADWKAFSWTSLPADSPLLTDGGPSRFQVLEWRGGYVASGSFQGLNDPVPTAGLWTSADGETWAAVTSIRASSLFVSVAPVGLIAIVTDPAGPDTPQSVWTSADGVTWHDAGRPNLPGTLVSVAGTNAGIVASVDVTTGTGKAATEAFLVEFSTDGVNWTPETVGDLSSSLGGAFGSAPHVQTNNGQFYLMGTAAPPASISGIVLVASVEGKDEMWLSGDGRTWTRSAGGYSMFADFIDFGRDGLLLHTNANAIPGATGLAYSADGGKTWHDEAGYAPLGQATCQGECSNGPDGTIGANGTVFVAVKSGGTAAWISYDAHTWAPIAWSGGDPATTWYGGRGGFVVLPRGVLAAGAYGAAQ